METQPIKTPNFTRLIAEVRAKTFIDEVHADALEKLLQEHCRMLEGYYIEEYLKALDSARSRAYGAGYSTGYSDGYSDGYSAV